MPQLFPKVANSFVKWTLVFGPILTVGLIVALFIIGRSPYYTRVDEAIEQPVPFSHKHHVGGLGIDCRYCHTSVEKSAFAGIPSTSTCMKCHTTMWKDSPMLEPVRESAKTGESLEWVRVYDLPDFVYFNHSIHVKKGVSCKTCHGQIDQMPLTRKKKTLHMNWCLECHKNPENFIGPKEAVFSMDWEPKEGEKKASSNDWVERHKKQKVKELTNCTVCHR